MSRDGLLERLEADRSELIDLSLRNPLLNHRLRSRSLELSGPSAEDLFRLFSSDAQKYPIWSEGEPVEGSDPAAASQDVQPGAVRPVRRADGLWTALPPAELTARLLKMSQAARASLEERGLNTLYLAIGQLQWREKQPPVRDLRAPLVLLPVRLGRRGVSDEFWVQSDGQEATANSCLAERLSAEFGFDLPALTADDGADLARYFRQIEEMIRGRPNWRVEGESLLLDFFSFGKDLMFRDLQPETWPGHARIEEHRVMRALLGDGFPGAGGMRPPDSRPEAEARPVELQPVLDADASQMAAIREVALGHDLIIKGPPGTGKSQTITNLIAQAILEGKTVLFVAEKLAALEVVKRRLNALGLGEACLELHGHKSSTRSVLDQLRRTLGRSRSNILGGPRVGGAEPSKFTGPLDELAIDTNRPIGDSGLSPHEVAGASLAIGDEPGYTTVPVPLDPLTGWGRDSFERASLLIRRLAARLEAIGSLGDHPFARCRMTSMASVDLVGLREAMGRVVRTAEALREASTALACSLNLPIPDGPASSESIRDWGKAIGLAVGSGADSLDDRWDSAEDEISVLLKAGRRHRLLKDEYGPRLKPEAWECDVERLRRKLRFGRWRRWLNRWVFASLAGPGLETLVRVEAPRDRETQLAILDAIQSAQDCRRELDDASSWVAALFGPNWKAADSDWDELERLSLAIRALRSAIRVGRLPREVLDCRLSRDDAVVVDHLARMVELALVAHQKAVSTVLGRLDLDERGRFGAVGRISGEAFASLPVQIDDWRRRLDDLKDIVAFNEVAAACRAQGLGPIVEMAYEGEGVADRIPAELERSWYAELWRRARRERPALGEFDLAVQESRIASFCRADRSALIANREMVREAHRGRLPGQTGVGQVAVLRRELAKKARHLPIRQLMTRAGQAVQAATPVFLMSPLSVSSHLPPGLVEFDLVVFDEASQIRPVEALGALLRGRQAVVVGDDQQLPPGAFFDRLLEGDDHDPEEDETSSSDLESILGLFSAQGAPMSVLRWHYRSRHESLIAVSNREFYDTCLVHFPSPDRGRREAGLVIRHLPHAFYDRGRSRTNPAEADTVAAAVLAFAREQAARPAEARLSLGVATFSAAQMDAIADRIERRRRGEPNLDWFFDEERESPFFVKNLENVQGDERDVIFISVGYGRTADGSVSLNFGPINNEGGERRLNVLFTRARIRCEVFTNLRASDLDPGRVRSQGVRIFRTFLAYAESCRMAGPAPFESPSDQAPTLASAIARRLEARGHRVELGPIGGPAGPDLAVLDPSDPDRFLIGVLTDGPNYVSAGPARDRDRLRPELLRGLGWNLHQAWTAEWLDRPEMAERRLEQAIEAAGRSQPVAPTGSGRNSERIPGQVGDFEEIPNTSNGEREESDDIAPYSVADVASMLGGEDLPSLDPDAMAGIITRIVRHEGPVHRDEVERRIADATPSRRLTAKLAELIGVACARAMERGEILPIDEVFLDADGGSEPTLRSRGNLPASSRRLDRIPPSEVRLAIVWIASRSLGVEAGDLPTAVGRLFGFQRISEEFRGKVEDLKGQLLAAGVLRDRGDYLFAWSDASPGVTHESVESLEGHKADP